MLDKIRMLVFRFIRFWIKVLYPEIEFVGTENIPDGPAVIVGNHAKMNGPIACELYFPGEHYTWTAHQMMEMKEVPDYSYQDFWGHKPGYIKWYFRILSYIIAPFASCIFNSAHCIPVYHDTRLVRTYRESINKLESGVRVIILPEHDVPHNNIVCDFQDKFIDVARFYYRRTGQELSFVPMYVAPRLHKVYLGKPIRFDSTASISEERHRIANYLMDEITNIAETLPEHKVVPYPNVPRRDYPYNKEYNYSYESL